MKNKTIATCLTVSFVLCVIGISGRADEGAPILTVAGLGMIIFGIFAIIRLYQTPD